MLIFPNQMDPLWLQILRVLFPNRYHVKREQLTYHFYKSSICYSTSSYDSTSIPSYISKNGEITTSSPKLTPSNISTYSSLILPISTSRLSKIPSTSTYTKEDSSDTSSNDVPNISSIIL